MHDHLREFLEPYGFEPNPAIVGLWRHKMRPQKIFLCADDFGITYWSTQDANQFCNAIGATFKHTVEKEELIIAV